MMGRLDDEGLGGPRHLIAGAEVWTPAGPAARAARELVTAASRDAIVFELGRQFPGWRFWYVELAGVLTWMATPEPALSAPDPEMLADRIRVAHESAAADFPALAGIDDYAVSASGAKRPRDQQ